MKLRFRLWLITTGAFKSTWSISINDLDLIQKKPLTKWLATEHALVIGHEGNHPIRSGDR